jgi:hypothetical protein
MSTLVTARRCSLAATVAPLIAVFGLLLAGAPAAHAQFTDTFSTSPDTSFNNASGSYSVSGGTYGSTLGTGLNGTNFLISTLQATGYSNLTFFNLQFDMLNARDSGAIFRSDASGSNSDLVNFNASTGLFYFVPFVNDSPRNIVGQTTVGSPNQYLGQSLRFTVSATATTYTASFALLASPNTTVATINATNQDFLNAGDAAPALSGAVGVYQYGGAASASRFDNVVVTGAPEPGALLLLLPGALALVAARRRRA